MKLDNEVEDCLIPENPKLKGENNMIVFTIRTKKETIEALNQIAHKANRSRSEIVNRILNYGIQHYKIEPQQKNGDPAAD